MKTSIPLTLDKVVLARLVFIDELTENDEGPFLGAGGSPLTAQEFHQKTMQLDCLLDQYNYSVSIKKAYRIAWREFFVFLEANTLDYSLDVALAWANYMRRYTAQWRSFRRSLMLFEQFRVNGQIDPKKVYTYEKSRVEVLPAWCISDLKEFCCLKQREGYARSTLDMYRSSCLRILEYMQACGVDSWDAITPTLLKDFHFQDQHSTPEGKNACSSKIRSFFEYLGEIGQVAPTLFMAVPNEVARRVGLVSTLSSNELEDIHRFRSNANRTIDLRHSAIITIGLRMGIRACDIVNLKFLDVSWEQKIISFQQQKTGVHLRLPMPIEVGNALYRYIAYGRPKSSSEYIFVTHRAPYGKLHPSACGRALKKATFGKLTSFHLTRKTFASKMLKKSVPVGRIAETLGHISKRSVMPYLSTNDEKMRLCPLTLEGIPVKGGALI